jgi:hypothetical protein
MTATPTASINPIAEDSYRMSIALPEMMPGGFSFNQYLVVDEMPLSTLINEKLTIKTVKHFDKTNE